MYLFLGLLFIGYGFMMLLLAYGLRSRLQASTTPTISPDIKLPKVSVVVAARNEALWLPRLLEALSEQTTEKNSFEVIIVDDHSTDQTADIVNSFTSDFELTLIKLKDLSEAIGKKAALQAGISVAKNEVILMTDADCLVEKDWIISYQKTFTDPTITMVAGLVVVEPLNHPGNFIEALDLYGLIAASAGASGINKPFICNGANMAFLKASFTRANGYAEHEHLSSGDDVFLLHRFRELYGSSSIRWNLHSGSWVKIIPTNNIRKFIGQRLRWASKSKYYKNSTAIIVAILVLASNAAVMFSLVWSLVSGAGGLFLALFTIKLLTELPLMGSFIHHIKQHSLWIWLVPASLLYPIYTTILGITSLIWKPRWKGRKIK